VIVSLVELKRALRRYRGVILYEGASALDGAPVVAIANRIMAASTNTKTGAMVQTWILRSDVDPVVALASGADSSVCGDCRHRPRVRADGKLRRTCYVNIGRAPLAVYRAYRAGRYLRAGIDFSASLLPALFGGLAFRIGSYGDPCAVPFQIWRAATLNAAAVNGYTHQWRDARFAAFKLLCMASVDSAQEAFDALRAGWRYFRVRGKSENLAKGEVACPASAEMGHRTSCAACRACGGLSARAKASIAIVAHGATAGAFEIAA